MNVCHLKIGKVYCNNTDQYYSCFAGSGISIWNPDNPSLAFYLKELDTFLFLDYQEGEDPYYLSLKILTKTGFICWVSMHKEYVKRLEIAE
jgi:hypothetical protein